MKKLFLSIFLLGLIWPLSALQAKDPYIMTKHTEGFLFFVYPQKISVQKNALSKKDLLMDFTYLTSQDSIALTATYITSGLFPAKDAILSIQGRELGSFPMEVIYRDKKKNNWYHRVRITIPFELFEKIYADQQPYTLSLNSANQALVYSHSQSQWKKEKGKMADILQIIRLNKE